MADATRALALRAQGVAYPEIGADQDLTAAEAQVAASGLLAERRLELEPASDADVLELERLAFLERNASAVLRQAAARRGERMADASLALRAIDRLLMIAERRQAVSPARPVAGPAEQAVDAELALLPEVAATAAAVAARLLARRLDGGLPPADMAQVARELRVTLAELARSAPQEAPQSKRDELRERREARLASGDA